jgi:hypothetical protein
LGATVEVKQKEAMLTAGVEQMTASFYAVLLERFQIDERYIGDRNIFREGKALAEMSCQRHVGQPSSSGRLAKPLLRDRGNWQNLI